jgi:hypothetical protein
MDQRITQFAQYGRLGSFVERCSDILRRTSHLVNAIRQVGRIVGRQHDRVGGQSRQAPGLTPVHRRPLLVCPLPAGLPTVLATTTHPDIGHVSTAPAARLGAGAAGHACDFNPLEFFWACDTAYH